MGAKIGKSGGPQADINITPLVDVVLVLLIIFMVITPMLELGAEVKLPEAKNAQSKEDSEDDLIVSVTKEGEIYKGNDLITPDLLQTELENILLAEPWKPIVIKGDVQARYADVRQVMEICEKVGAKSVSLMTDKNTVSEVDEKKGS